MATAPRSEFRSTRDYHIGVMAKREDGKMKGINVPPKSTIWLDEEEQIATANAPRDESDNPFVNGDLELVTEATMVANRRPIGDTALPQVPGPAAEEPEEPAEPAKEPEVPTDPEPPAPTGDAPPEKPQETEKQPEPPAGDAEAEKAAAEAAKKAEDGAGQLKPPQPTRKEQEESRRAAAERAQRGQRQEPTETGAAKAPSGEPPKGSRAAGEEIGTPEAVEKG